MSRVMAVSPPARFRPRVRRVSSAFHDCPRKDVGMPVRREPMLATAPDAGQFKVVVVEHQGGYVHHSEGTIAIADHHPRDAATATRDRKHTVVGRKARPRQLRGEAAKREVLLRRVGYVVDGELVVPGRRPARQLRQGADVEGCTAARGQAGDRDVVPNRARQGQGRAGDRAASDYAIGGASTHSRAGLDMLDDNLEVARAVGILGCDEDVVVGRIAVRGDRYGAVRPYRDRALVSQSSAFQVELMAFCAARSRAAGIVAEPTAPSRLPAPST